MSEAWSNERLGNLISVLAGSLRAETGHFGPEIERLGLLDVQHDRRHGGQCLTCAVLVLAGHAVESLADVGLGDDADVEAGRCCPHCRRSLTEHNGAVWSAGYAVGVRHSTDGPFVVDPQVCPTCVANSTGPPPPPERPAPLPDPVVPSS